MEKAQRVAAYRQCPGNVHPGLEYYFEHGADPGDFLSAVLCNDLKEACMYADNYNQQCLFAIVSWLHNVAPNGSWGSIEAYAAWIAHSGFAAWGRSKTNA
jgi:hypothetical protein